MIRKHLIAIIRSPETWIGMAILIGFYLIGLYSYLVFHNLAELATIMVAWAMFSIAWNSQRFLTNSYLLLVGIAFFFIGIIDLLHTLAFKGMGVFTAYPGANLATQLWVTGRYLQSLTFLVAPLLFGRKLKAGFIFLAYALFTILLLTSIFYWRIFPDCYVEGKGLTEFKKISEYIISLILVVSLGLLLRKRQQFDPGILRLLLLAIVASIGSELIFTTYVSVYDLANLAGHMLKLLAFYFIYKAIIATGLVQPYRLLFRDLQQNKDELLKAKDWLEVEVAERTAELRRSEEHTRASVEVLLDGFARMVAVRNEAGEIIDFRFEYINEAGCRLNQRSCAETIGNTLLEIFPAHKPTGLFDEYVRVVETGEPLIKESFSYEDLYNGQRMVRAFDIRVIKLNDGFVATWRDVTKRKLAEEALWESNQLLEQIFSNVDFLVAYMDARFNFIRVNRAYAEADNKIPEYFVGRNHFDLYPHEENAVIFRRVVETGEPYIVQARPFVYAGSPERGVTYWNWALQPVKRLDGTVTGLVLSLVDVTERERAASALKHREEELSTLFEILPVGVSVLNHEGRIVEANPELCRILDLSMEDLKRGEYVRRTYLRADGTVIPPSEFPSQRSLQEHIVSDVEIGIVKENGETVWVNVSAAFLPNTPPGVVMVTSDITEHKEAEAAVVAMQKHYQALIENAPDGIALLDAHGILHQVTPSTQQILGYSLEEAISQNPAVMTHPDDLPALLNLLNDLMQNPNKVVRTEYRFRHKDGTWRWLESTISNMLNEPSVEAIVFNYRDVTDRKQAQAALTEKERLLSETQRIGHVGSLWYDIRSDVFTFSDEMYRLLDVYPEEFNHHSNDLFDLVFPPDRPLTTLWVENLRVGIQARELDFRVFHKNGELHYLHCTGAVDFNSDGKPIRFIGTAQDVTENRIAEIQIGQQIRRLTALNEIDRAIMSSFDLNYTLNVVVSQTMSQLQVDAANVLLLDAEEHVLEYATGQGFRTKQNEAAHIAVGTSHAGRVVKERRILRIPDLHEGVNDPLFQNFIKAEGFVTYIAAPLIIKGDVKGVLEAFQRSFLQPFQEWLDFFSTLAGQAAIAIENANLFGNLQATNDELSRAYDATIEGWSRAMDLRDRETEGHTQRVTSLTLELARTMKIEQPQLIHIRRGGLLHDIGKLGVPDHILFKRDKLTDEEWQIMQKHPQLAYEMLSPIEYLKPALNIPYCHHERWDGSGYPCRLKGEDIPPEARIFSVVDVWDALTTTRPYRPAWKKEDALQYIYDQAGKHFDPQVVNVFIKMIE